MTSSIWESKLQSEIQTLPLPLQPQQGRQRPLENGPSSYQIFKEKYTYPIPKPADKKKYPSNTTSTLVQAFSSEPAANRASPRASAALPSSFGSDTLLSLFWSKLTAFIFQRDVAVMIPSLSVEFYQVSPRLLQHLVFPHGLRI